MAMFTEDFVDFFKELSKNNNKKWFDQNKLSKLLDDPVFKEK